MKSLAEILKIKPDQVDEVLKTIDYETEYLKDGTIYCIKCNEPRSCFGITTKVRIRCKCQKEEDEKLLKIKEQIQKQETINKLKCNSLLGEKYKNVSFDNTEIYSHEYGIIYNRCKKYCEVADEVLNKGIGIYLFGTKGTGKTHLTSCMANELMNRYKTVIFTNFSEISKNIRSSFNGKGNEVEILNKLTGVDFLFIDDFGTEMVNRNNEDLWLQEKIFEIINTRYNNNKPIIFSSNYSLLEMLQQRGLADKTVDRINEKCESMKIEGRSYRLIVKNQTVMPF